MNCVCVLRASIVDVNDAEISAYLHDVSVAIQQAQEKTQDHSNDERPTRKVVFGEPPRSSPLFLIFLLFFFFLFFVFLFFNQFVYRFSHCFKSLKNVFHSLSFLSFLFVFSNFYLLLFVVFQFSSKYI